MATIAVRVGREVKEISGLTKSSTCWDVVLALLKENTSTPGTESAAVVGASEKTASGERGEEESGSNSSSSKSIKEIAQSYVIVENWRGCEKPIPPRTRILNVWQAWGKEQRHVELSLKKSKHIRYRESGHNVERSPHSKNDEIDKDDDVTPDHYSLHCMTHHQKRKIRRSMKQYQRALLKKQNIDDTVDSDDLQNIDENNSNARVLFEDSKPKVEIKPVEKQKGIILSEEKFVDGFLADPDCLVKKTDRAQLISQGTFNREVCKYRRRNHRRLSSVDGVVGSRQHRRRQVPHYPYSSHHYRRRSSRHRGSRSKSQKSGYRYSTDDTSTTTTTTTNSSEDEKADDADDEKSVLMEFARPISRRTHPYAVGIGGCTYGSSGTTTTATDSSTTTSGDSMTSSVTSSETSSGGDYYIPELNRLAYARIASENMKTNKLTDNSSNKPKKNKSILGGFSKPALNLIESFRKTNLKRKAAKKNNQSSVKQETTTDIVITEIEQCETNKTPEKSLPQSPNECEKALKEDSQKENIKDENTRLKTQIENVKNCGEDATKATSEDPTKETENSEGDEVLQTAQSQDIVLKNQEHRLADIDTQIEQIEHDIHGLRTRALGKNYVQDTYLSGLMDSESNSVTALNTILSGPSIPVTTPWILQCEDVEQLEQYIKYCEKIVQMQIKIEEHQRKSEIVLQDIQEEVWRVPTYTAQRNQNALSPVSKAAALMLGFSDEDDISDDETGHESLLVKSWNESTDISKTIAKESTANTARDSLPLELEMSRTELEASLYLSLRLSAEIDEVEHKLGTSDYLIQAKGENLIKCVRDMAMSEKGIDPEVWEEYGELLTAYDLEVVQRNYLDVLDASHMAVLEADTTSKWQEDENTHYIDATSPNPTYHCVSGQEHIHITPTMDKNSDPVVVQNRTASVAPSSSLNQALTPWVWCEHCKIEEQLKHAHHHQPEIQRNQQPAQPAVNVNAQPPASFSDLPLPKPINKSSTSSAKFPAHKSHTPSVITPGLLPMLPIPDGLMSPSRFNDSDYEDLPDLTSMASSSSENIPQPILKTDCPVPRTRGLLPSTLTANAIAESSNNTDDSGNASAGSTASFASSDGSRNSSCDGGSPRPIPSTADMSGSKPLFGRNGVLRGSWRGHFVFPLNSKQNTSLSNSSQNKSIQSSKPIPPPLPPAYMKPRMKKPEPLPKPSQLTSKKSGPVDANENELLMQQQKLIRRNSGSRKKNNVNQLPRQLLSHNSTENNIIDFKHQNTTNPKILTTEKKLNLNYDNDSDTGRSSLGSSDSDQLMISATLV